MDHFKETKKFHTLIHQVTILRKLQMLKMNETQIEIILNNSYGLESGSV